MNMLRSRLLAIRRVAVALCASVLTATGQVPHDRPAQPAARDIESAPVRVTTRAPAGDSVKLFTDRRLVTTAGQELGTIRDLVLDPHSGNIAYAAVATRSGGELRLVPFSALKRGSGQDTFTVSIALEQWTQIAPINPAQFDEGRIMISEAEQRQLATAFRLPNDPASTASARPTSGGAHLVRLGDLRGKRVSTGSEDIGTIDDVIIEAERATAAAVVTPERDFAPVAEKFVVPLQHLNLASREQSPIATTLTRADFEQARMQRDGTADTEPVVAPTPAPARSSDFSPTGRNRSAERQTSGALPLSAPIHAVQQLLASEATGASASVQVTQENDKVELRGSVPSQELKEKVERVVRQSAPHAYIENNIRVETAR